MNAEIYKLWNRKLIMKRYAEKMLNNNYYGILTIDLDERNNILNSVKLFNKRLWKVRKGNFVK